VAGDDICRILSEIPNIVQEIGEGSLAPFSKSAPGPKVLAAKHLPNYFIMKYAKVSKAYWNRGDKLSALLAANRFTNFFRPYLKF
jgi:hypothetical protein